MMFTSQALAIIRFIYLDDHWEDATHVTIFEYQTARTAKPCQCQHRSAVLIGVSLLYILSDLTLLVSQIVSYVYALLIHFTHFQVYPNFLLLHPLSFNKICPPTLSTTCQFYIYEFCTSSIIMLSSLWGHWDKPTLKPM